MFLRRARPRSSLVGTGDLQQRSRNCLRFHSSERCRLRLCKHSGLNLNIQIQKVVFRFNSIQVPIIQYSGFIQYVIPWQVLAQVKVSEDTSLSTVYPPRIHSPAGASIQCYVGVSNGPNALRITALTAF